MDLKSTLEETEQKLLLALEGNVRGMFVYTGWEDGIDDEPRVWVKRVESSLNDLTALRKIMNSSAVSAPDG
jgi:hypothetical protein